MKKIKVTEATQEQLEWLITAIGQQPDTPCPRWNHLWAQWEISHPKNAALGILGQTPSIAVMRHNIVRELGDVVEVPDTLA